MSLLLREVRIVPVRPSAPSTAPPAEPIDVVVESGVVTAVGRGLAAPAGADVVAADGRWLIPGLWDHHVHLLQWAETRGRLDTSAVESPAELLDLVRRTLGERTASGPLVAWGHRPATWTEPTTVADLDAVSGDRPVILVAGDGHHAWVNTAGLRALGLPEREGVVQENEWYGCYDRLTALTGPLGPDDVRTTLEAAAAAGVVGIVDLEFVGGPDAWREWWAQGCDLLRVRAAVYAERLEATIAAGLRSGDELVPGDPRLVMGPLKIISDGSLNTGTAWCCDPYPDGTMGAPNQTQADLAALHARAHGAGLEVATHAIGDAAVRAALDAYAATGARGSVEHAQLVATADVVRLAELGLRASVQPAHLLDDRDPTEFLWPGRGDRCFPFRTMLDAGVDLRLGSDAPVSPLEPWLAMSAAVHRSADERPAWHPEQALTAAEALAASTDAQGTVAPGSRGDLVLLDHDPLADGPPEAQAARLRATTSALTVVAGRIVHRAL